MSVASHPDTRRAVVRALTDAVRSSPLSGLIDPRTFLLMLDANYAALQRPGGLDLTPVWTALGGEDGPDGLVGLFLEFGERLSALGLSVTLPQVVARLSREQREQHRARFAGRMVGEVVGTDDDDGGGPAVALSLASGDVRPFIPPDVRRQAIHAVVQALKGSAASARLEGAQLAYQLDASFEQICDGRTFDFAPILAQLRALPGFKDEEVFLAVVRLERSLGELRLQLRGADLAIDRTSAPVREPSRLKAQPFVARPGPVPGSPGATAEPAEPAADPASPAPEALPEGGSMRERRLARWGLLGFARSRAARVRLVLMTTLLLAGGGFAWVTRPDRDLDAKDYGELPLRSARLRDGTFEGVLDDDRWWPLPGPQRERKVKDFEARLREEGRIPGMQVRDGQRRLVLTTSGGRVIAAPFLLHGTRDGKVPPGVLKPAGGR